MPLTKPKVSKRGKEMPASPIRKLIPLADEIKKKGVKVYHLNIGQPDIPTPVEFMNAIRNYPNKVLAYGNSKGDIRLIQSMVEYYERKNIFVQPENIQITTGGSEALIFAMICISDVGEEIIVFEPFYTNYNSFARMADINLVPIPTKAENGYHLPDKKIIEKKITSKTRGILLATPNNPTGTVFTKPEMETIAELAKKHDLFFLSDEVYREFIYEGVHTSVMNMEGIEDRAILLDSISKRYSACGARIGCLVSKNKEVTDTALKLGQSRLCSPSIEQYGAIGALGLPEDYFLAMADEYKRRRDTCHAELMKIPGVFCQKPSGAFYIMAKFPVMDIEDFARWMLSDFSLDGATTMIAPGPGFYASKGMGKDEARIAYVLNVEDLKKAMRILAKGVEQYKKIKGKS
ncbi:MAG: aspartate aminotransferase [candidate division Zixibacteria bacterium RBG_16_43_9]|nr:MAG: aspartate aminotransferase [candidate division Zixibacteria bacterium RBG_16_43_9]